LPSSAAAAAAAAGGRAAVKCHRQQSVFDNREAGNLRDYMYAVEFVLPGTTILQVTLLKVLVCQTQQCMLSLRNCTCFFEIY